MGVPVLNFSARIHSEFGVQEITHVELAKFAQIIGLNAVIQNRFSWIFVMDIYLHQQIYGINPAQIVREIFSLEDGSTSSRTKAATQFNRAPLFPLWHKHYFSSRFIAKNIQTELKNRNQLEQIIREEFNANPSGVITDEVVRKISSRVVHEPFDSRSDGNRLTGEWIVFSKQNEVNTYLCLATHNTGDQEIFDKLTFYCTEQYPEMMPFKSV